MSDIPSAMPQGTAIVTGGARGIGLSVAKKLLAEGHPVALWDVAADEVARAAESLSQPGASKIFHAQVDVTDPESVAVAYIATVAALGPVTVLVNNAGVLGWLGPVKDIPLDQWNRVFAINLTGTLICSQSVLPAMLEVGYGRIINMASIAGKDGNAHNAGYAASKAAVIALTKSMGKELSKQGVLVNCVTPSAADTTIFGPQDPAEREKLRERLLSLVPMGRYVNVEEIAEMVAWLASGKCSFSTGAVFDISGGASVY